MVISGANDLLIKVEVETVPTDENALGRWSRLKKARKDRASSARERHDVPVREMGANHGSATPTAFPIDVDGEFRPWLPPLTEEAPDEGAAIVSELGSDEQLSEDDRAIAQEMNLPDIDALEESSDYSVFLSDGVPDTLRRLALRKLWATNPLFGVRDGLNDYDEDFRVLSDFVYNSDAMKRFTEPKSEKPEDVSENHEDPEEQVTEDQEPDTEENADIESEDGLRNENAQNTNGTQPLSEDDDALEEDDPELG